MTTESMSRQSKNSTTPIHSQSTSATEDEDSTPTGIQVSMEVAVSSSLATFIKKLWIIVNDANLQSLIHWSDAGDVICIPNVTVFSKRVLPKYFKHGNWQSFVRQLNMYGFRRVYSPTPTPLTAHHTRSSAASNWPDQAGPMSMMLRSSTSYQFMNENFVRDDSQRLVNIKRKAGSNRQTTAVRQQQEQERQQQQQATNGSGSQGPSQSQSSSANHVPISTEATEQIQERVSHLLEQLAETENKLEVMQNEAYCIKQIQIQQQQVIRSLVDSAASMFKEKAGLPEHQLQLIQTSLERLQPFVDRLGSTKEISESGGAGSSGSGSHRDDVSALATRRTSVVAVQSPKAMKGESEENGRPDSYSSLPHKRRWSDPSQELLTGPRLLPVPHSFAPPSLHRSHATDEPRLPPISEAISKTSTQTTTLPPLSSTPETIQTQPTPTSQISPSSPFQLPPLGRKSTDNK